ncbi:MAG: hypothetical protein GY953_20390, partial [bacterium]|nr:hypothetical protein [bacterium]
MGLLSVSPTHLPSCGSFPAETIYTYRVYPRFQMDRYIDGDMGVVFPTFWRRFLLVAYRHFSENPLTETEQRAFMGERATAVNPL